MPTMRRVNLFRDENSMVKDYSKHLLSGCRKTPKLYCCIYCHLLS